MSSSLIQQLRHLKQENEGKSTCSTSASANNRFQTLEIFLASSLLTLFFRQSVFFLFFTQFLKWDTVELLVLLNKSLIND